MESFTGWRWTQIFQSALVELSGSLVGAGPKSFNLLLQSCADHYRSVVSELISVKLIRLQLDGGRRVEEFYTFGYEQTQLLSLSVGRLINSRICLVTDTGSFIFWL